MISNIDFKETSCDPEIVPEVFVKIIAKIADIHIQEGTLAKCKDELKLEEWYQKFESMLKDENSLLIETISEWET